MAMSLRGVCFKDGGEVNETEDWKVSPPPNKTSNCPRCDDLNKELIESNIENDRFRAALHRIANKSSDPMAAFLANKALGRPT